MYGLAFPVCFSVFLFHWSYAQNSYIPIVNYPDKATITRLAKRESARSLPFLVYQPTLENNRSATSVLLLRKGSTITYWLIRRDTVTATGVLAHATQLFTYSALARAGATKQEDRLKFVPPVVPGLSERIIYADASRQFFFEPANPVSYIPNAAREKYRSEWATQIRRIVKPLLQEK